MPQSHDLVAEWNKFSISAAGSQELCTKPTVPFPSSKGFSHSSLCFSTGLGFLMLPQNTCPSLLRIEEFFFKIPSLPQVFFFLNF